MIGAIIGDIAGSIYEFDNITTKDFPFFGPGAVYTDDSILTLATAEWLMKGGNAGGYYARYALANPDPMGGYGGMFRQWAEQSVCGVAAPYNSCGNGSAMRVGPVGWTSDDKAEVMRKAQESAACTHSHPEGVKGAQAVALCILMARRGDSKDTVRQTIEREFGYDLSASVACLQQHYSWQGIDGRGNSGICQHSVPQAIVCALEASDFEDAVRNAVSIGGDSDTIACITGAVAEALYGVPQVLYDDALRRLPPHFQAIIKEFEQRYGNRVNCP